MNGLYELVDEDFLQKLYPCVRDNARIHLYNVYKNYLATQKAPIAYDEYSFLKNANRKKYKLVQIYCPYCGTIGILPLWRQIQHAKDMKFCVHCGKRPLREKYEEDLLKHVRIKLFTSILEEKIKNDLYLVDFYQIQISTLLSIIEIFFRENYVSLMCMKHYTPGEDARDIFVKEVKNDFQNPGKIKNYFQKSFGINIKDIICDYNYFMLDEIALLRHAIIHNNGYADSQFLKNPISSRIGKYNLGSLLVIDKMMVEKYFNATYDSFKKISREFESTSTQLRYRNLSLHYSCLKRSDASDPVESHSS